jgi:hypothetical protein
MDERKVKDVFVLKDGTKLHSLKDLYGHLSTISEEDFSHHVNEQKNDFAAWIEHTHRDKFLAQSIRQAKSKEEMQKQIFISMFR